MQSLKERILKAAEFNESLCNKIQSELLFEKDCTCDEPELGLCPYHDDSFDLRFGIREENARLLPLIEALADAVDDLKMVASGSKCSACSCSCHQHASDAIAKLDERLKEK